MLIGRQRRPLEERHDLVEHRCVIGHLQILCDDVGQPEQVVRAARPRAATGRRMPPVLDVALDELAARRQQQVLAVQIGPAVAERHHVLQLITEAVGAAGLVEPGAGPQTRRDVLVQEPPVHHQVERVVRCAHLDGTEDVVPQRLDGTPPLVDAPGVAAVYSDLGFDGPVPLLGTLDLDAPVISMSSLAKAFLAPGWRTGWMAVASTPRLDPALAAMKKLADGRLCSPAPMQYAVKAALAGDRSHQVSFRMALAERARITTDMLNAIPGMTCVAPRAAFYALPSVSLPRGRTDEDYVLALLRHTGILCVNGSGFGLPAAEGFFRIVFLANPEELSRTYADIGAFTHDYLSRA